MVGRYTMKIKTGTVQKRCPNGGMNPDNTICNNGELYKFKNGIAIVPGARFNKQPIQITIKEFNSLIEEINYGYGEGTNCL